MGDDLRHVHIIGVGGIGTSALAQYYLAMGHVVSGSDANQSDITDFLKSQGKIGRAHV